MKEAPKKEEKKAEPNPNLIYAREKLEEEKLLTPDVNEVLGQYEKENHPIEPYLIANSFIELNKKELFTIENRDFVYAHPKEAVDFANVMILLHEYREKGLFTEENQQFIKKNVSELYYIHLGLKYLAGKPITKKEKGNTYPDFLTQDNFKLFIDNTSRTEEEIVEVKKSIQNVITEEAKKEVRLKEVSQLSQLCALFHELRIGKLLNESAYKSIMKQAKNAGAIAVLTAAGLTHRRDLDLFLNYFEAPTPALEKQIVSLLSGMGMGTIEDYFSADTIKDYACVQLDEIFSKYFEKPTPGLQEQIEVLKLKIGPEKLKEYFSEETLEQYSNMQKQTVSGLPEIEEESDLTPRKFGR